MQLKKLSGFISKRKEIAARYKAVLKNKSTVTFFPSIKDDDANHYRFVLLFKDSVSRNATQHILKQKGIPTIIPIDSFQLLHNQLRLNKRDFPVAENMARRSLSVPVYPCLTSDEVLKIVESLMNVSAKLRTRLLYDKSPLSKKSSASIRVYEFS